MENNNRPYTLNRDTLIYKCWFWNSETEEYENSVNIVSNDIVNMVNTYYELDIDTSVLTLKESKYKQIIDKYDDKFKMIIFEKTLLETHGVLKTENFYLTNFYETHTSDSDEFVIECANINYILSKTIAEHTFYQENYPIDVDTGEFIFPEDFNKIIYPKPAEPQIGQEEASTLTRIIQDTLVRNLIGELGNDSVPVTRLHGTMPEEFGKDETRLLKGYSYFGGTIPVNPDYENAVFPVASEKTDVLSFFQLIKDSTAELVDYNCFFKMKSFMINNKISITWFCRSGKPILIENEEMVVFSARKGINSTDYINDVFVEGRELNWARVRSVNKDDLFTSFEVLESGTSMSDDDVTDLENLKNQGNATYQNSLQNKDRFLEGVFTNTKYLSDFETGDYLFLTGFGDYDGLMYIKTIQETIADDYLSYSILEYEYKAGEETDTDVPLPTGNCFAGTGFANEVRIYSQEDFAEIENLTQNTVFILNNDITISEDFTVGFPMGSSFKFIINGNNHTLKCNHQIFTAENYNNYYSEGVFYLLANLKVDFYQPTILPIVDGVLGRARASINVHIKVSTNISSMPLPSGFTKTGLAYFGNYIIGASCVEDCSVDFGNNEVSLEIGAFGNHWVTNHPTVTNIYNTKLYAQNAITEDNVCIYHEARTYGGSASNGVMDMCYSEANLSTTCVTIKNSSTYKISKSMVQKAPYVNYTNLYIFGDTGLKIGKQYSISGIPEDYYTPGNIRMENCIFSGKSSEDFILLSNWNNENFVSSIGGQYISTILALEEMKTPDFGGDYIDGFTSEDVFILGSTPVLSIGKTFSEGLSSGEIPTFAGRGSVTASRLKNKNFYTTYGFDEEIWDLDLANSGILPKLQIHKDMIPDIVIDDI